MIVRNFNLHLNAGHSIPLVINVNQYDSGEQWVFTLYNSDGTQYVPSTGAIVGIKSDGLGIINSGSVVDGKVVINETKQMTAAVGKNVFELLIDDQTHGTANFIVLVEPKPGDQADLSESDLSLIQQAIDHTSPAAIAQGVADWMDDNLTPTTPVVDASLTVQGAAADAKKTGDEISDLKSQIGSLANLETSVKTDLVSAINEANQHGGSGGGSLATLSDVTLSNLSNGQAITYDSNTGKWKNVTLSGGGSVQIDSVLSSTSENPVQNKVINTALSAKADSASLPIILFNNTSYGTDMQVTVGSTTKYFPDSTAISHDYVAKSSVKSTVTVGDTNPVNSDAVIAYINSLDATNTSY